MVVVEKDSIRIKPDGYKPYDVVFGDDLSARVAKEQRERWLASTKFAILTDSNVKELYASPLEEALKAEGLDVNVFTFEAGEQNKSIETCVCIIGKMTELGYGRDSVILNVGGGVVSDLGGFIASTFNRGFPYINIPTSLVGRVDASVGGKTAVNTVHGKNLIGVIKQPAGVYVDVSALKTLSGEEFPYGMSETIKHAIILDAGFFDYLLENSGLILQRDPGTLLYVVKQSCIIKGKIVERDPKEEKGPRMVLNYGHTTGHTLEKSTNYKLPHGAAVSVGMMAAGRIAVMLGYFSQSELARQEQLLLRFGLPVTIPEEISAEAIIKATVDKKAAGGRARYALPSSIGRMNEFGGAYATFVDNGIVKAALHATR